MNYYTIMSSNTAIPCTKLAYDRIVQMLLDHDDNKGGLETTGIKCEWNEAIGEVYFFAEEVANPQCMSEELRKFIGRLLKKSEMPYVEFQLAFTADREAVDSQGGAYMRLLPTGELVEQVKYWPARAR